MQMHFFTSRNGLLCFHTSREQGCCLQDLMTVHTDVDKIFTNVQAMLLLCLYHRRLSFTSPSLSASWFQLQ